MKRWVVLSCTPNSAYDFFLPIATRLWKTRIGYEPIIVLVGVEKDWSFGHAKVVYEEIRRERVEFFSGIPNIPDSTVSMGLRQHVAALDFDPDDVLLVGDVDLFPVDKDFYHRYDPSKSPVGIYHAEMYNGLYWPAYGISMPVRNWREVMGVTVGDFRGSVERAFLEGPAAVNVKNLSPEEAWTFDERYASHRIRESRFAKDASMFSSCVGNRRPHRAYLPHRIYASDYVDFHCGRPGWSAENWPSIRCILSQIIPDDLRWVDQYVDAYLKSV